MVDKTSNENKFEQMSSYKGGLIQMEFWQNQYSPTFERRDSFNSKQDLNDLDSFNQKNKEITNNPIMTNNEIDCEEEDFKYL